MIIDKIISVEIYDKDTTARHVDTDEPFFHRWINGELWEYNPYTGKLIKNITAEKREKDELIDVWEGDQYGKLYDRCVTESGSDTSDTVGVDNGRGSAEADF